MGSDIPENNTRVTDKMHSAKYDVMPIKKVAKKILSEEIDEEILRKMPEWFKRLREAHLKKLSLPQGSESV